MGGGIWIATLIYTFINATINAEIQRRGSPYLRQVFRDAVDGKVHLMDNYSTVW